MVLDLAGLLRALVEGGVRFIVIGGIAVAAHRVVRGSWEAELGGVRFSVCSLDHLIAMKEARGAAIDQADLERLREP